MPVRRRTFEKKKEKRKINLKIEVKDFGPISSGKINLKPLTIFVGPNNAGKSYVAMLVHSIFESYAPTLHREMPFFMIQKQHFFTEGLDTHTFLKELERLMGDLKEGVELEIPEQFREKITHKIFKEIYEKRLNDEIIRSYACPLKELIRIGRRSFALKINFNSYSAHLTYQKDNLKIKEYPQLDIKIIVKVILRGAGHTFMIKDRKREVLIEIDRVGKEKKEKKAMITKLMDLIFEVYASKILEKILGNAAMQCYYLPAARSGILLGHKALAASMVKNAPYVGIERREIPKLSGVVSDFISYIITLPEEKGPFYQLAQEFEKELIKGEIVVRTLDKYIYPGYPEIKYIFHGNEIPLHRASSTVSELAPLFLYLKYIIEPESILIIEEPEAHLHPKNQRILAKFLVKLIRKGVNIVITTHSHYLLEQLSSFILLSKIEPQRRVEKYGYGEEDFLKPDEIAAYMFDYDKRSAGYKIMEVEITEEDGISQEEFIKIDEVLYEETIKLRRDLMS